MFVKRKLIFWLLIVPGFIFGVSLVGVLIEKAGFRGFGHVFIAFALFIGALRLSVYYAEWITWPQVRRKGETYGKHHS